MKRRLFLRGIGGAALAAPFFSSLQRTATAAAPAAPRRMVIFYTNNGCITEKYFPAVTDAALTQESFTGTTLELLGPKFAKLVIPRGLAMFPRGFNYSADIGLGDYFDPHDQGMGSKLTAAPIDPAGSHYAMSRSLDHVAAELVNPSGNGPLVLSVGRMGTDVKSVLSYSAANTPYPPETNPANVYNQLTGLFPTADGTTEGDFRVKQGESVIDLVGQDLQALQRLNMSGSDQQKLQDWLDLLRTTEVQVTAACNGDTATMLGITDAAVDEAGGGGGFGGFDSGTAFTLGGDMMIKLIALTMMCDANRSIILQWPGFVTFNWDGIVHEYTHHGLSHRNGENGVTETPDIVGVEDMIWQIDNWYAGKYAALVNLIDSINEGDVTMLHNSAVMWLPELADGNAHNNDSLPITIAGSLGGYLKNGVTMTLDDGGSSGGFGNFGNGGLPLNKLFTTLLNGLGATNADGSPIQSFGTMDNNDSQTIANPGELDAIKA